MCQVFSGNGRQDVNNTHTFSAFMEQLDIKDLNM